MTTATVKLSKGEALVLEALEAMGPRHSLQPIGELAALCGECMPRGVFNGCLWSLACKAMVDLHGHDYPHGMTAREKRRALVIDGRHFIGAATR